MVARFLLRGNPLSTFSVAFTHGFAADTLEDDNSKKA
jgi:hypothetical protein